MGCIGRSGVSEEVSSKSIVGELAVGLVGGEEGSSTVEEWAEW